MRSRIVLGAIIALLMTAVPGVAHASAEQTVTLVPNGGSGVNATLTINGTKVTGKATGLDPSKRYISLYYGSFSTSQVGQLLTCADPRTAASPRQWGISPEWVVNSDGTGTLNGKAQRLTTDVYTVSIREVSATALPDPYVAFNPVQYPVRACGAVQEDRSGVLGTVPNVVPPIPQLPIPT